MFHLIIGVLCALVVTISSIQANAQVDFTPPAIGTTLTLSSGFIKIDKVEGRTVTTTNSSGRKHQWNSLFYDKPPTFSVPPEGEKVLSSLWPLSVGNSGTFTIEGSTLRGGNATWRETIRVLRTEEVAVQEKKFLTYVVEYRSENITAPGYVGYTTYWYAPQIGFHLKYDYRFDGNVRATPTRWTAEKIIGPTGEPL